MVWEYLVIHGSTHNNILLDGTVYPWINYREGECYAQLHLIWTPGDPSLLIPVSLIRLWFCDVMSTWQTYALLSSIRFMSLLSCHFILPQCPFSSIPTFSFLHQKLWLLKLGLSYAPPECPYCNHHHYHVSSPSWPFSYITTLSWKFCQHVIICCNDMPFVAIFLSTSSFFTSHDWICHLSHVSWFVILWADCHLWDWLVPAQSSSGFWTFKWIFLFLELLCIFKDKFSWNSYNFSTY